MILPVISRVKPGLCPVAIVETPRLEQLGCSLVQLPVILRRLLRQEANGEKKSGKEKIDPEFFPVEIYFHTIAIIKATG